MSDELMIQPQVQRTSAAPYVLGGGIVGAGAALGASELYNRYGAKGGAKSYEELIKDAEEKDKVELTSKKKALEEAEAKLAEAKKAVYEGAELNELNKAKENLQKELDRLVEAANNRDPIAQTLPSRKVLKEKLSGKEFDMIESYVNDYETARTKLLGTPGKKLAGATAESAYKEVGTQRTKAQKFFEATRIKDVNKEVDRLLPKSGYKSAKYSDFKKYQEMFGEDMFSILDKKPDNPKDFFEVQDAKGKKHWVEVDIDAVKAKREALKNEFKDNIKRTAEIKKELKDFDKEFLKANEQELKNDLTQTIKTEADLAKLKAPKDYKPFFEQIEDAETSIKRNKKTFPLTIGTTTIKDADGLREFRIQLEAEKEMAIKYTKAKAALENELKAIVNSHPDVKIASSKLRKTIAEDKGIKDVLESIERRFNGKGASEDKKALFAKLQEIMGSEAETASTAELEEAAKKKDSYKRLAKIVEEKQAAYDKIAAEKGKVNETVKKEAEDLVTKTKGELDKLVADLGGKAKGLNGKTKAWIAAGAAAVGMLIGNSMVSSKNKAAEREIYG